MQPIQTVSNKRVTSIDLLRGMVMVIMALDHVRDYFHKGAFIFDPLDLEKTSTILFFTRWITHFCAPVFMLLAGTAAFISGQKKSKKELSLFLLTRGLWLIFLELSLIGFGWNFDIGFSNIYFIVIWALGFSMIVLAGLIHLPFKLILAIGILLVAGHNLLDGIIVTGNPLSVFGWSLLHQPNFFAFQGKNILIGYPVLPWIGVMTLGYCMGILYKKDFDAARRKKILLLIGSGAIVLFILVRLVNIYGDPAPWSQQSSAWYSVLSFIKVSKYPPSLLYILMTLGPALLFLAVTERVNTRLSKIFCVYGRVPMFYYVLHIFFVHFSTLIAAEFFTGFGWQVWILEQPLWFTTNLKGYGFSLTVVYLVWIGIVAGLYPLCKWYDHYKTNHKEKWWLSYL